MQEEHVDCVCCFVVCYVIIRKRNKRRKVCRCNEDKNGPWDWPTWFHFLLHLFMFLCLLPLTSFLGPFHFITSMATNFQLKHYRACDIKPIFNKPPCDIKSILTNINASIILQPHLFIFISLPLLPFIIHLFLYIFMTSSTIYLRFLLEFSRNKYSQKERSHQNLKLCIF